MQFSNVPGAQLSLDHLGHMPDMIELLLNCKSLQYITTHIKGGVVKFHRCCHRITKSQPPSLARQYQQLTGFVVDVL